MKKVLAITDSYNWATYFRAKNLKENLLENNSENLSQITHYGLNISDNSLIFFPSYMEHAVHMNKTHNPRITISGNTFVG